MQETESKGEGKERRGWSKTVVEGGERSTTKKEKRRDSDRMEKWTLDYTKCKDGRHVVGKLFSAKKRVPAVDRW